MAARGGVSARIKAFGQVHDFLFTKLTHKPPKNACKNSILKYATRNTRSKIFRGAYPLSFIYDYNTELSASIKGFASVLNT
jgi:hypothetical protein